MSSRRARRARERALQTVSGVALLAAVAASLAVGGRLGVAPVQAGGPVQVEVPPSASTLVCPGPLVLPGGSGRGDAGFDPVPVPPQARVEVLSVAGPGAGDVAVTGLDAASVVTTLPAGGGSTGLDAADTTTAVRAAPAQDAPLVAATAAVRVTDGDLRGTAAASCTAPGVEQWLVGGSTAPGATAQLLLVNAGLTAAQVEVRVLGAAGPVDLATDLVVVAPGDRSVVDLTGAAPGQPALVVHVSSTGGQVAAYLQDARLDGFTPAGVEVVAPSAAPATRQRVPGVSAGPDEADSAVLRLLATERSTTATVTVLGEEGPVEVPGLDRVPLTAGTVVDVPLTGLAEGERTVVVDAGAPVVAAAESARTGEPGELDDAPRVERAWSPSTPGDDGVVALPAGMDARIVVGAVAAGDAAGEGVGTALLRVLDDRGEAVLESTVSVDAGTTGSWDLAELSDEDLTEVAAGVQLVDSVGAELAWSVLVQREQADGTLVSVLVPVPAPAQEPTVAVVEDPRVALRG